MQLDLDMDGLSAVGYNAHWREVSFSGETFIRTRRWSDFSDKNLALSITCTFCCG